MSVSVRFWVKNTLCRLVPLIAGKGKIVVCGMPKSGTTAVAQLLGDACGLSVCSDPFFTLDQHGVAYRARLYSDEVSLEQLWNQYPWVFKGGLVKDPNFPLLLDQLYTFLPDAQYVFLVRDPRQNIRSILNRLDVPGDPAKTDLASLSLPRTWRMILEGRDPHMPGENYIEKLAWRWRLSAEAIQKHRTQGYVITYEAFNANKQMVIEELAKQLGFPVCHDISEKLNIQFQPAGNKKVTMEEFFSAEALGAIEQIVGEAMTKFGYE